MVIFVIESLLEIRSRKELYQVWKADKYTSACRRITADRQVANGFMLPLIFRICKRIPLKFVKIPVVGTGAYYTNGSTRTATSREYLQQRQLRVAATCGKVTVNNSICLLGDQGTRDAADAHASRRGGARAELPGNVRMLLSRRKLKRTRDNNKETSSDTTTSRMLGSSKSRLSAPGGLIIVILVFPIARVAPRPDETLTAY
ncbi:hypothetical protein B0H13DRAFT_1909454 [Mycena leptocephala]|nr:hypothetical protein B0H13DRAFT_1909454 [Mycena leptocephala]